MTETVLSVLVGLGLAAACGFRVFIPLLIMSLAVRSGHLTLAANFQWIASDVALITFVAATALEVTAYYVPWLDNFLDSIATPSAVVAGTIVTAAMVTNLDPFLKWTLAVIAGGGLAGLVQSGTVVTRAVSSATSGGLANPVVSTAELGLSSLTSVLAVLVPIAALLLVGIVGIGVSRQAVKRWKNRPPKISTPAEGHLPPVQPSH